MSQVFLAATMSSALRLYPGAQSVVRGVKHLSAPTSVSAGGPLFGRPASRGKHSRDPRRGLCGTAWLISTAEPAEVNGSGSLGLPRDPDPLCAAVRGERYVLRTALSRKVATAPLASSGAFGLVLHWPLCEPDVYLGPYPAK
jgi:hypothetical protein